MFVRRLKVAESPLLCELDRFVGTLSVPGPPYFERGDWRKDVQRGHPAVDIPRPLNMRCQRLSLATQPSLPAGAVVSAANYYPVGGAGLGWHTDSANAGWRVYLARPLTNVSGLFITDEEVIEDVPGVALGFYVGDLGKSWHAVVADGPRFSIGVRVKHRRVAEELGIA
jgi:hypothetical protein